MGRTGHPSCDKATWDKAIHVRQQIELATMTAQRGPNRPHVALMSMAALASIFMQQAGTAAMMSLLFMENTLLGLLSVSATSCFIGTKNNAITVIL